MALKGIEEDAANALAGYLATHGLCASWRAGDDPPAILAFTPAIGERWAVEVTELRIRTKLIPKPSAAASTEAIGARVRAMVKRLTPAAVRARLRYRLTLMATLSRFQQPGIRPPHADRCWPGRRLAPRYGTTATLSAQKPSEGVPPGLGLVHGVSGAVQAAGGKLISDIGVDSLRGREPNSR